MSFKSRIDAGKKLAHKQSQYQRKPDALVLALPRGAISVAQVYTCTVMLLPFYGVGMWYDDFSQTTDAQLQNVLK